VSKLIFYEHRRQKALILHREIEVDFVRVEHIETKWSGDGTEIFTGFIILRLVKVGIVDKKRAVSKLIFYEHRRQKALILHREIEVDFVRVEHIETKWSGDGTEIFTGFIQFKCVIPYADVKFC
jgi:hypothetical protein